MRIYFKLLLHWFCLIVHIVFFSINYVAELPDSARRKTKINMQKIIKENSLFLSNAQSAPYKMQ